MITTLLYRQNAGKKIVVPFFTDSTLYFVLTSYVSLGAPDSCGRDVPQYTEIISKFPVLVQAGHSAYPGWTPNGASGPQSSVRPHRSDTRLGAESTVWCSVYRGISRPANRARLIRKIMSVHLFLPGNVGHIPLVTVTMTTVNKWHPTLSGKRWTLSDQIRSLPTEHKMCRNPLDPCYLKLKVSIIFSSYMFCI